MRNLCQFCHYHVGNPKEKTIKIAGSFLAAAMLFTLGFSSRISSAAQQNAEYLSQLLPEPGYLIAATGAQEPPTVEAPAPPLPELVSPPPPPTAPGPAPDENERAREEQERFEQERQKQELMRWRSDRLRETRDQLREIAKVRKQFVRLKGSQDEIAKLEALSARITQYVNTLNTTTDLEDLGGVLEDYDGSEIWDELNRLRAAIEIPRELNNLLKDLKRLQSTMKQKWVAKIIDRAAFGAVVAQMQAGYDGCKALYQQGEYEEARECLQENFNEKGWPGECMGALHMMRGGVDQLRGIKDKELKAELESLMEPVKSALLEGECREARETAEAIQRELAPQIWKLINDAQRRRREIPDSVFERIEKLRSKLEEIDQKFAPKPEEVQPVPAPAAELQVPQPPPPPTTP